MTTLLVIEDDLTSHKRQQVIRSEAGYDVQSAHSAEEALELVRSDPPSIIIVDLLLPGMMRIYAIDPGRPNPSLDRCRGAYWPPQPFYKMDG